jgi:hypothetical protein
MSRKGKFWRILLSWEFSQAPVLLT